MSVTEPKLRIIQVPIERLHPNPWNPNVVPRRTMSAIGESLKEFGEVDGIKARPHPTLDGVLVPEGGDGASETDFQIVDGEHRWEQLKEKGATEAAVIPLNLTDAEAKKLTVILNETRGEADTVPLAQLLVSLQQTGMGLDELLIGLPYEQNELSELLKIGALDWDTFDASAGERLADHIAQQARSKWAVTLDFDEAQHERWETLVDVLRREAEDETFTIEATVLHLMAAAAKAS